MKGYAIVAYRAARLAARLEPAPDLVVFCIDTQGDSAHRAQMEDGLRQAGVEGLKVALAVAHQESEAWVVSGFVPNNTREKEALRRLIVDHGFDPTTSPHRLTPNRPTDPHDAKRACDAMLPDGTRSERAAQCWLDTSIEQLEERGAQTGLPEYLADIRRLVLPMLGARPSG